LPELVLASLIAAFAICGILLTYVTCVDLIRTSKNASVATSAAQGLVEEIRSTPFPQIIARYNQLSFIVNGIPGSNGIVNVDDTDPELLLVTVRISWQQGTRTVELATRVANR